jgi:hypothetical protein
MVEMMVDKIAWHYRNNYDKCDQCLYSTFIEYKHLICCVLYQKYHKYLRVEMKVA